MEIGELHVVFGLFYALTIVTAGRGIWIALSRIYLPLASPRLRSGPGVSMSPAE